MAVSMSLGFIPYVVKSGRQTSGLDNIERIRWDALSVNQVGIELLKKNKDKIHYHRMVANPAIFVVDEEKYQDDTEEFIDYII